MISIKYLSAKEVSKIIGFHRMTIFRMVKTGRFPKPIKIGVRRIAWLEEDLKKWMDDRIEERGQ